MDSKIFLFSIVLILVISLIPTSFAELNLEGMSLLSNDGSLVIEFGKNVEAQSKKMTPTLNYGLVQTVNHDFLLDFSDDVSIKVYGNSFVIKSLGDFPLLIYAQSIGGDSYSVNAYTVENGLKKQSFAATLEPIGQKEAETPSQETERLPEMKLLVKQTDRVYWKNSYFITARVFDAELNRFNEFDQNWGYITGIDILVEIFDRNDVLLTNMSGQTGNTGYFDAQYYVVDRLVQSGEYTVNVTADNGQVQLTKTLPMFILGERPSAGNSTGP